MQGRPPVKIKLAFRLNSPNGRDNRPDASWLQRQVHRIELERTGDFRHVELYFPRDTSGVTDHPGGWISSVQGQPIQFMPNLIRASDYCYCSAFIPEEEYLKCLIFAMAQVGKPHNVERSMRAGLMYILWKPFQLLVPEIRTDMNSWYCSELLTAILAQSPVTRLDGLVPSRSMPQCIYDRTRKVAVEREATVPVPGLRQPPFLWKLDYHNDEDMFVKVGQALQSFTLSK